MGNIFNRSRSDLIDERSIHHFANVRAAMERSTLPAAERPTKSSAISILAGAVTCAAQALIHEVRDVRDAFQQAELRRVAIIGMHALEQGLPLEQAQPQIDMARDSGVSVQIVMDWQRSKPQN